MEGEREQSPHIIFSDPNKNKGRVLSCSLMPELLPSLSPPPLAWSVVPSLSWGQRALLCWWDDFYASLPQARSWWHPLAAELWLLLNARGKKPPKSPKTKTPHSTAQWQRFHLIRLGEGAWVGVGRGKRELNKEINFSLKALKGEGTCEWLFKWHH